MTQSGTPALAEWYTGAYLGTAHSVSSSLLLSQPSSGTQLRFSPVSYRSDSFKLPLYYGYRVGYFLPFAPYLGAEAEFIHLKVFAETDRSVMVEGQHNGRPANQRSRMDEIVQNFSISHGMNLLLLNAAIRYPMSKVDRHPPRAFLMARLGAGPTIPHPESRIEGATLQRYEIGSLGVQGAAGAQLRLRGGIYALAEYKFTRTRQSVTVSGGTAGTLLKTHHGVLGLAYHF